MLLFLSLTVAFTAEWVLTWLAVNTVGVDATPARWVLSVTAFVLGMAVNTLPAMALLTSGRARRFAERSPFSPSMRRQL